MNARDPQQNVQQSARHLATTPRGVDVTTDRYAERAESALFWDVEDRCYVDFTAGVAMVSTGHRHPRLAQTMHEQLDHFMHTAFQIMPYGSHIELAERLNTITPGMYVKETAFFTADAEAVENAIKTVRARTGRPGVIVLVGAFHDRTFMDMSLTDKVVPYKTDFGSFSGSVYHVSAPVALHDVSTQDVSDTIQCLFEVGISPRQVTTVILEPVQGEGGFYQMFADFIRATRTLYDEYGIVMIADEVQIGFTRIGKLFTTEHTGVLPDITTTVKGLAGSPPLSAAMGHVEIMGAPAPGGLDGIYAGNPLVMASAYAVLDIIAGGKFYGRSVALDTHLVGTLDAARTKQPRITEVRGVGAIVAVEFNTPGGKPDADLTELVQQQVLEAGLLLSSCGAYGNVIHFLFLLAIGDAVFGRGLAILQHAPES